MNKSELIAKISDLTGQTKTTSGKIVDAFITVLTDTLSQEEDIVLVGFGTFKVIRRASRKGVNPQTGQSMIIPASNSVSFKAGKNLKEIIN